MGDDIDDVINDNNGNFNFSWNMPVPLSMPAIEHARLSFDEFGNVSDFVIDQYGPGEAKAYLDAEVRKKELSLEYQTQQMQMQMDHERYAQQMQMQMAQQMMGFEVQKAQYQLAEAYTNMQNKVLSLMDKVNHLEERTALPAPDIQKMHIGSAIKSSEALDCQNAVDAEYEIVNNKIDPVIKPNHSVKQRTMRPELMKKNYFAEGRIVDDEKTQEEQEGTASGEALEPAEAEKDEREENEQDYEEPIKSDDPDIKYVKVDDHTITYNNKTGRFDNVPFNFEVDNYAGYKLSTKIPAVGAYNDDFKLLIKDTIPLTSPGWAKVKYDCVEQCNVDKYAARGGIMLLEEESFDDPNADPYVNIYMEEQLRLSIFHHDVGEQCAQYAPGQDVKYWEAYDISFNPMWKMIVGKHLGGLTNGHIAIVRLLYNNPDGFSCDYLTMYMRSNSFSNYFEKEYEKASQDIQSKKEYYTKNGMQIPQEVRDLRPQTTPIVYSFDLINDPVFAHVISALFYAYTINGNKGFVIVEQICDRLHDGQNRIILSKNFPKTEIREEWNIFKGPHPDCVYTNMDANVFFCTYDVAKKAFVITRRFKSASKKL
jgi:hypothetical protein